MPLRTSRLLSGLTAGLLVLGLVSLAAPVPADVRSPVAEPFEAGDRSFAQGNFAQALASWNEALSRPGVDDNPDLKARLLLRKTAGYLVLGMHPEATTAVGEAMALADTTGDRALIAEAEAALGNAHLSAGRLEQARSRLESAVQAAEALGRPDITAAARNNLGNLLAARGAFTAATAAYKLALTDATSAGNEGLAAKAAVNLARAYTESRAPDTLGPQLRRALDQVRALPPSHDQAYALIGLGRLYLRLEPVDEEAAADSRFQAYRALREGAAAGLALDDPRALSYAYGYLGELYERSERAEDALRLTRRALHEAQRAGAAESLYLWQWQTGRLLRGEGDASGAISAYERAVYTLEGIRPEHTRGYLGARISFRERVGPVYLELADLLLRQAVAAGEPAEREDLLKAARQTVELLKGAELADYFQDECVAEFKARTAGIEEIGANTAAIYPIILADRTEILLSLPDGIRLHTIPLPEQELTREIRLLRQTLETRVTHRYLTHARQIYDWFIRPLEPELERHAVDTLVFVPDGPLRTVPLSALHDGEDFLIARYGIATTPGLTLTDPQPLPRGDMEVLLSGLTESVQGFPPLPNVADEIASVSSLYGGTVLMNDAFVAGNVEANLERAPYTIVHVASHAQFGRDVEDTFLLTYTGKLEMNELDRLMGLTAFRERPVELLTLSACQTAAGDDRAALGLAGVAVKAGARSALATLWFVNDPASAKLVSAFYRELRDPAKSKAEALRQAQLELLQDRRYRHPAYWSPFLLIGNWL